MVQVKRHLNADLKEEDESELIPELSKLNSFLAKLRLHGLDSCSINAMLADVEWHKWDGLTPG